MCLRILPNRMVLAKGAKFNGIPRILTVPTASIKIGTGTLINSSNRGYHLNMHSPCKLYVDRPGAEIIIGDHSRIHGTCIHAYNRIEIGNRCLIAANTQIIDGNGHELLMDRPQERIHSTDKGKPIVIEDDVWIAANCIILGGTTIGKGSVIAANTVVKGVIPPNTLYKG